MRLLITFSGLLFCLATTSAIAQPPRHLADRVTAVENSLMPYVPVDGLAGWNLAERMRHHRVPGVSIAVIRDYKIDWARSYGLADTTARKPVTTQTMFSAGSISKLVTAMAALRLVDTGKLDLDQPVNTYLTSWKLPDNDFTRQTPVTLRLLLSHRGGTSQSAYFGFTPDKQPLPSVVAILAGAAGTESRAVVVNSAPGQEFRYSGGGYMVAQLAMMDHTGQDFAPLTDQLLFKPLRLQQTTFAQPLPPALALHASWAYSANGWFKGMPYVYPQQAAAGLYTTPTELAKLVIDLQKSYGGGKGLLSQASAQAMMTPLAPVSTGFYKEAIGLGVFLLQQQNNTGDQGRYFNHTGVNAGFIADATGSLAGGNGVVVMMNDNNGASELGKEIRRAVAHVYGWTRFLPPALKTVLLPDSLLDAYAGRYQRGPDEVVTFKRSGNWLIETINEGNEIICVPAGRDTISFTDYTTKAFFSRGPSGKVDSVRIEWDAKPMPRLPDGTLLPNELIRRGRITEAVAGYRTMHLNVSQLTYMAYNLLTSRPANLPAAEGVLELANEQFPNTDLVYARLGDLYRLRGDTQRAINAYQTVLTLNPLDTEARQHLEKLGVK